MTNNLNNIVKNALAEDIGSGDVSIDLLTANTLAQGRIISRQKAVLCGTKYAERAFLMLDQKAHINWLVNEGDWLDENSVVCTITAAQKSLLSAERTALNFLQLLSATATQTRRLVEHIKHTPCRLLDTRKTIPNLRVAQKQAVICGGGVNHRFGLFDAIMLKENHIRACGGISQAINKARTIHPKLPLIVEVENLSELTEALLSKDSITRILCDNFAISQLKEAVKLAQGLCPLEASGNIDEQTISAIADTGVDFISSGALTKNIVAVDFSMQLNTVV